MSIVLVGSTSGSITLQEPAVAGSTVLSLPATTGTVLTSASPSSDLPNSINGPAFSAYLGSTQYPTATVNTILQINTKEFDTANCFNTSNYSFTPNVAGYYLVTGQLSIRGTSSATRFYPIIYKNGNIVKYGNDLFVTSGNVGYKVSISSLIYMNGSTDYLQLGGAVDGPSPQFTADNELSNYFQAFLARAA